MGAGCFAEASADGLLLGSLAGLLLGSLAGLLLASAIADEPSGSAVAASGAVAELSVAAAPSPD